MNYQAYKQWLKDREADKVPPHKSQHQSLLRDDNGSARCNQASSRLGR